MNAHFERAAALVHYDPATGEFARAVTTGSRWRAGQRAGTFDAKGYVVLNVGGRRIKAHRLAWFIVHGEIPHLIDHINGDPADNRIANLRSASKQVNCLNIVNETPNSTGFPGVKAPTGRSRSYSARITDRGRRVHLGSFPTAEDAYRAYSAARQRILQEAIHAA